MASDMRDRPIGDQLCDAISDRVFEWMADSLGMSDWRYHINDVAPVLLCSRDPDVWPLFVDVGDARYAIECDVTVRRVIKGSPEDGSCTEDEAYPEVRRNA